jgi:hypothetical protein
MKKSAAFAPRAMRQAKDGEQGLWQKREAEVLSESTSLRNLGNGLKWYWVWGVHRRSRFERVLTSAQGQHTEVLQ